MPITVPSPNNLWEGEALAEPKMVANGAKLQKSAGEGGEIAKIGGVKLQKSAGNFAIMSATLRKFGKEFWNALGKAF